MFEKMIEQFWKVEKNASPRDKVMILLGILFGSWLIYIFISAEYEVVSSLQETVSSNRELLLWMKSHASMVEAAHVKKNSAKGVSSQNLLGVIDATLRANHLENSLQKSEQLPDQKIHLVFTQVAFDPLMAWLMGLRESQNLEVTTFSAQSLAQAGSVNAEMVLSLSRGQSKS